MPLDPDVAVLVAAIADGAAPALTDGDIATARKNYDTAPRPPADDIAHVVDRQVATDDRSISVRCYCVDSTPSGRPIIMFAHGGGWVLSSVDSHDHLARRLALVTGSLVVSVDYRRAPEHPFPAAHDDCWDVFEMLRTDGAAWGGDPTRVAVAGDSAGANLAAGVALRSLSDGPTPCAQVLVYPCIDDDPTPYRSMVDNASGYFLGADDMAWFWSQYLGASPDARFDPRAVPARASTLSGLPPSLVITAEFDPLRDEGEAYASRLAMDGVTTTCHRIPGVVHGFIARWHQMRRATDVHQLIGTWFVDVVGNG